MWMILLVAALLGTPEQASQPTVPKQTSISGAGSSFVFPIFSQWIFVYEQEKGITLQYLPISSEQGIQRLQAGTTAFAVSEYPLSSDALKSRNIAQFPLVIGGVVVCANLPDLDAQKIVLDGKTLVKIYTGSISHWNDPEIVALNGSLKMPERKITPIFRQDGSGTSWAFSKYLGHFDESWKEAASDSIKSPWKVGIGARGNVEAAAYVSTIPYSLGYVEFTYAIENQLSILQLKNDAGKPVRASLDSFKSAASKINWEAKTDFLVDSVNQKGAESWPILAVSYMMVNRSPKNVGDAEELLNFCRWVYINGGKLAEQLNYLSVPDSAVAAVESYWQSAISLPGTGVAR